MSSTSFTNFSPRPVYLPNEGEDEALVGRCRGGETAAFEVLVGRYQRVLFNVALRMLSEYADAADATQNAFVKAFEKLDSYDRRHRFFSWIYRILRNECLNVLRGRRPQEPVTPQLAATGGPLEACEAGERRQRVQAALAALPPDYREVVVLRHFVGLSYEEMSTTLAIPEKTVKSRLYTARQRLGQMLLGRATA